MQKFKNLEISLDIQNGEANVSHVKSFKQE